VKLLLKLQFKVEVVGVNSEVVVEIVVQSSSC
jgi:hypothetical protein